MRKLQFRVEIDGAGHHRGDGRGTLAERAFRSKKVAMRGRQGAAPGRVGVAARRWGAGPGERWPEWRELAIGITDVTIRVSTK